MKITTLTILGTLLFVTRYCNSQIATPTGLKIDSGQKVVFGDDAPLDNESFKETDLKSDNSRNHFIYDPVKNYLYAGTYTSSLFYSKLFGPGSTTLGTENQALGNNAIAGGNNSTAYSHESIAFGFKSVTSAASSQCFGQETHNNTPYSMVIGVSNDPIYNSARTVFPDSTSALFLIGNGSQNGNRHSNAMEVYYDGTMNLFKPDTPNNIHGLSLQNDDVYMDAAGPQKFGDNQSGNDGGRENSFMLSTGEGSNESSGIYGDGDAIVLFSEGESPGTSGLNGYVFIVDASNFFGNDNDPYNSGALKAYIDGSGIWQTSDKRKKENIKNIVSATDKINMLNGYTYSFKELSDDKSLSQSSVGYMAQELQKVIPEAVQKSAHGDYFVNYTMVVPVLTEALKEQNEKIELLMKANEKMAAQIQIINARQQTSLSH